MKMNINKYDELEKRYQALLEENWLPNILLLTWKDFE